MQIARYFYVVMLAMYRTLKRFFFENFTYQISALAFISLLSLIPALSIIIYFFSLFNFFHGFFDFIENYIYLNFMPDISSSARAYIEKFAHQAQELPFLSIVFSFITSILMMLTIERAFESIWQEKLNKVSLLSRFLAWTLLFSVLFIASLITFVVISLTSSFLIGPLQKTIVAILHFLCNILLLAAIYVYLPIRIISWRDGILGGIFAASSFEIGKILFRYYINYLTNYQYIYGALSIIPIFILWVYFSWIILLLPAIFIHEKNKIMNSVLTNNPAVEGEIR